MATSVAPHDVYAINEKVFVAHASTGQMSEARVMKVGPPAGKSGKTYLVRYENAADRRDEWVNTDRMLKFSDEVRKVLQLGRSRRKQPSTRTEPRYQLEIPISVRWKLMEDQQNLQDRLVVQLPRVPTVRTMLENFQASRPSSGEQMVPQLAALFDEALGSLLLYRHERLQYERCRTRHPDLPPSQIYGLEHLLRLFAVLPELIEAANPTLEHGSSLMATCNELIKYLNENLGRFSSTLCYEPNLQGHAVDTT
eukprot:TRINITY_DN6166_c0_g1_i2.p1 TRINITY_DN6166_c0_g1~~TRINITY_DN6166_c0_g1_i2.p1  ORF type:complete len:253 (+),score=55.43 TRINITY_DN6166_c0_g1_i2:110-868(+)